MTLSAFTWTGFIAKIDAVVVAGALFPAAMAKLQTCVVMAMICAKSVAMVIITDSHYEFHCWNMFVKKGGGLFLKVS